AARQRSSGREGGRVLSQHRVGRRGLTQTKEPPAFPGRFIALRLIRLVGLLGEALEVCDLLAAPLGVVLANRRRPENRLLDAGNEILHNLSPVMFIDLLRIESAPMCGRSACVQADRRRGIGLVLCADALLELALFLESRLSPL